MKNSFFASFIFLWSILFFFYSAKAQVLLYANNFENPVTTPTPNCGPDLDATLVNTLWGGTGQGTGGGGTFRQLWTVETMLIKGPNGQYEDPSGKGGNYCLSMLSAVQDDRLALVLNTQNLKYVNLSFDFSGIDLAGCGGPFGVDTPIMSIKMYKLTDPQFNFGNPGELLDEADLKGTEAESFTFNWQRVQASLIAGEENDLIALVFDLVQSGYAAFDNIRIEADENPLPVVLKNFAGNCKKTTAALTWTTSTEANSAWFDVEASANGYVFQQVGRVLSQNSPSGSQYSFDYPGGCRQDQYYRLAMVDKDGTTKFSPIIQLKSNGLQQGAEIKVLQNGIMLSGADKPQWVRLIAPSGNTVATRLMQPSEIWYFSGMKYGLYYAMSEGLKTAKVMIVQ
jgi:hypothetical protein